MEYLTVVYHHFLLSLHRNALTVLATPDDLGRGKPIGTARHVDILIFPHRHRRRCTFDVQDVGRHDNLEVSNLAYHRVSVHLAHIITPVLLLRLCNVQQPCVGVIVRHAVPWDARYHMPVYRQYHLPIDVYPRDFEMAQVLDDTREVCISAHRNRHVGYRLCESWFIHHHVCDEGYQVNHEQYIPARKACRKELQR
uniref:Putative secreted protein n=1 Tax=Anopheles darlingi TaxID=43151 RepID=A0A2M4DAM7_ANODA